MSRPSQGTAAVHLAPWGPETPDKIAERHLRFQRLGDAGSGRMFKIVDDATRDGVGSVGYWPRTWHDQDVYEMGWSAICWKVGFVLMEACDFEYRRGRSCAATIGVSTC